MVGSGQVDGDVATADFDVGIALDGSSIGWVIVDHLG